MGLIAASAELFLGASCVHCEAPGRLLCDACSRRLTASPFVVSPGRTGQVDVWAATSYEGLTREVIVAMKEHGHRSLLGPLSRLLAASLEALVGEIDGPVVLVPVPSRAATVRARGFDATRELSERTARLLGDPRRPIRAAPLVRLGRAVNDQAGLTGVEREANLAGAMEVSLRALRQLSRELERATVLACDDVVTTGATVRELVRALGTVDISVTGIGTIAATPRRT